MSPWNLPKKWEFGKYGELLGKYGMGMFFLNSVYYTVTTMAITGLLSLMAAYAFTRLKWKFQGIVFAVFILGLMIPIHSELVPLYIMMSKLGFRNPRFILIGIYTAFSLPISVYILSSFLKGIPREMEESAVIDGCSILRSFFSIIIPLMNPAIATVAILNFIGVWNDFFVALVFISQDKDKTLQLGIAKFQGNFGTDYSYLLAAIVLALFPTVFVYVFFQNRIIQGITAGAVKG